MLTVSPGFSFAQVWQALPPLACWHSAAQTQQSLIIKHAAGIYGHMRCSHVVVRRRCTSFVVFLYARTRPDSWASWASRALQIDSVSDELANENLGQAC